jgi:hypothetical protein
MSADIHGWIERRVGDKWIAESELTVIGGKKNWARFAALAGVRGDGPEPRGLPSGISETVGMHALDWARVGYAHSWLPIDQAAKIFAATEKDPEFKDCRFPMHLYFGVFDEFVKDGPERRVVFWFDDL